MKHSAFSRRSFIVRSALATGAVAFPFVSARNVLGANSRLNIAGVAVGGKGWKDITSVDGENIVGICDVDAGRLARAQKRFPSARAFADWRVMFDQLGREIDAVTVSTPDHTHFHPAYRAVKAGKHVFCQKPLTHTLWEARTLTEAARKAKVATQMGNQGISHPKLRRDAELIKTGVIGDVKEIHIWTDRPGTRWKQGLPAPTEFPTKPPELDWDLWLGGSARRPYHPQYSHFQWRGWWDYGTGAIGDMGCHLLNCATLAMDVRDPVSVRGTGDGATDVTGPLSARIEWAFPKRNRQPAWRLVWYDGGRKPDPKMVDRESPDEMPGNGVVFVGSKDTFFAQGYNGGGRFMSGARYEDFQDAVPETLPKAPAGKWDRCHYDEWIAACKGGPKAYSNFDTAGPVTEVVLLGTLALRTGQPLEWNARKLKVTNVKQANEWVSKEYTKGWKV